MFRKFILGAIAASIVATPMVAATAADAQTHRVTTVRDRHVVTRQQVRPQPQRQVAQRTWQRGQRFDRRHATNYREIDYRQYRGRQLYAPPRGYHWVRSGNDAVLVALTSGVIGAVIGGALR